MNDRVADLARAWLVSQRGRRGTVRELASALDKLGIARADVDVAVEALTSGGDAERVGVSVRLASAGVKRALAFLGVASLPEGIGWKRVKRDHLVPRALGVSAELASSADGRLAAVLARHERLPAGATLGAVQNALAWRALGVESTAPASRRAILGAVLASKLGTARVKKPEAALRMLAAKHLGARRADDAELATAAIKGWLREAPEPLAAFAARVDAAARAAPRAVGDKVFIVDAHAALAGPIPPLDTFKARLLEAQRADLVALSRADLVEALDPERVRASEVSYLDARFHFVRLTPGASR